VNSQRPVNLDLRTIKLPVTAYTSILHRISGVILFVILSALLYHLVAGVRHLIMDMGIGETLEGGKLGSKIVIAVSVVVIVLAGVWIW
jgi:succinate dehydrogenase / fumarate reductase cytochrome b subunit